MLLHRVKFQHPGTDSLISTLFSNDLLPLCMDVHVYIR